MNANKPLYAGGWVLVLSASLLVIFWILFAVFLPMQEEYLSWVLDDDWTWINIIGFSGSVFGILAIAAMIQCKKEKRVPDLIAYGSSVIGVAFLTSILFFEAFILKGIARISPELVNLNAGFYREPTFYYANIIGGIFFSLGIVGLGTRMIVEKTFKSWKLIVLMIGAPLFGIVLVPGNLRLVGVLLYSVGFIGIGTEMIKKNKFENSG